MVLVVSPLAPGLAELAFKVRTAGVEEDQLHFDE